jgi:hypothetical protein
VDFAGRRLACLLARQKEIASQFFVFFRFIYLWFLRSFIGIVIFFPFGWLRHFLGGATFFWANACRYEKQVVFFGSQSQNSIKLFRAGQFIRVSNILQSCHPPDLLFTKKKDYGSEREKKAAILFFSPGKDQRY